MSAELDGSRLARGVRPAAGERGMVALVTALFFVWGFATVLVDTLIPRLKALFELSFAEVMLTQFSFFIAYLLVSIPAGQLIGRIGYMRGIVTGLVVMATGGLLFAPAAALGLFPGFLAALFVLASGITILQVAANPLIVVVGDAAGSRSRLNLAQAFNSLGTTIGPWVGASLILRNMESAPDPVTAAPEIVFAFHRAEAHALQWPFILIASVRTSSWRRAGSRGRRRGAFHGLAARGSSAARARHTGDLHVRRRRGVDRQRHDQPPDAVEHARPRSTRGGQAGQLLLGWRDGRPLHRFGRAAGRFARQGVGMLRDHGRRARVDFGSFFGTGRRRDRDRDRHRILQLDHVPDHLQPGDRGLGLKAARGSGALCLAIVGGAIVPLVTGAAADGFGLSLALFVPAACYLYVAGYGWFARRPVRP